MDQLQRLYNLDPVAEKLRSVWRCGSRWLPSLDTPEELVDCWLAIDPVPAINPLSQNFQLYTFNRGPTMAPLSFRSFPYHQPAYVEAVDGSQLYIYEEWVAHFG